MCNKKRILNECKFNTEFIERVLYNNILLEPLARILFYSTSSINSVMNLHDCNILIITHPKEKLFKLVKNQFSLMCLKCNTNI
jgi:hypothetical protein